MKKIKILLLLVCLSGTIKGYAQNIFPEKFDGCNTDLFALESDTITAKIQDEHLIDAIMKSLDSKTREKIRGTLSLQIIVDLNGNSCLMSLKNDTNIRTKNLHLKQYIDKELKWENPNKKVAAIVVYRFEENGVKFKRLGMNGKRGVHELSLN
ncbi:MAG TPA: hypothetical protein VIU13_02930 [Chryseolinea sp.]